MSKTQDDADNSADNSLKLHKDLIKACANHGLSCRDTLYTLGITMHLVARDCGISLGNLNGLINMIAKVDLDPLLAALAESDGVLPETQRD